MRIYRYSVKIINKKRRRGRRRKTSKTWKKEKKKENEGNCEKEKSGNCEGGLRVKEKSIICKCIYTVYRLYTHNCRKEWERENFRIPSYSSVCRNKRIKLHQIYICTILAGSWQTPRHLFHLSNLISLPRCQHFFLFLPDEPTSQPTLSLSLTFIRAILASPQFSP